MLSPQITSLAPSSGGRNGGYSVTVSGTGFGALAGKIYMSAQDIPVQSWTDTAVTFVMPAVGVTGIWNLYLRTAENAATNNVPFMFTE